MANKRVGIAAAALMVMTTLSVGSVAAAPDPGLQQSDDLYFAAGTGGGDFLSDKVMNRQDDVIAKHKGECSC